MKSTVFTPANIRIAMFVVMLVLVVLGAGAPGATGI
jgi:hypothetical protein